MQLNEGADPVDGECASIAGVGWNAVKKGDVSKSGLRLDKVFALRFR